MRGGVIKRTGNHKPIFIVITHNKVINSVAPYVIISSHELSSIVRAYTDTEYELYRNPDAVLNNDLMSAIISAHKICVKNREDKNAPTIVKIIGGIIIDFTMIFLIKMVMERICEEK
mgnify:CR=1 FL=1